MIEQSILDMGVLEIVHQDMSSINEDNQELFAILRRSGLGASDSSVVLDVNPWKTADELIEEKCTTGITAKEIEIGQKDTVRKGRDLEPIVLSKFAKWSGLPVYKPEPMYRIKNHPQLTINFDGVTDMNGILIPVEAKCISLYGDKYWDKSRACDNLASGNRYTYYAPTIGEQIETVAKQYGVPPYYYTQIQQQMLGLNAEFGYLAVILEKGWDFKVYKIYRDERVQDRLIELSAIMWEVIQNKKGRA